MALVVLKQTGAKEGRLGYRPLIHVKEEKCAWCGTPAVLDHGPFGDRICQRCEDNYEADMNPAWRS